MYHHSIIRFHLAGISLGLLLLCTTLSAQTTQTFSNPAPIIINQVGHSSTQYPSVISVSGLPARLHEFTVRFNVIANGGLPDADILLETPDGQRLILMSDLPLGGIWSFTNIGIGTTGKDTISPDNINDHKVFRPVNYDAGPDFFPAPGPGDVSQPPFPDAFALQDINPNGAWKLYVMDDEQNTADLRLQNGWSIEITAADWNACKRPGVPQVVAPSDFGATLSWAAGAGNTTWDALITTNLNLQPGSATPPTHNNLAQNQNVFLQGLTPVTFYAVFVRADCGNGRVSPWVGPVIFQTTIHPCDLATPVSVCQPVNYSLLPGYDGYFFGYGKTWTFAFTAPEAGEYFMEFEAESGYTPYYRLNNSNNCDDGQWIPMEKISEALTFRLPPLAAGQTCWIIHRKVPVAHEIFRIVRCPLRRLVFDTYTPATDSLNMFWQNWPPITDTMEFYIAKKGQPAPDETTQPVLTGIVLPYNGKVNFTGLEPNTEYEVYARARCANGWPSCWQGPFAGKTGKMCGKVTSMQVDTTTQGWAQITFDFIRNSPNDPSEFNVRVCRPDQNPVNEWVGDYTHPAAVLPQQMTYLLHSLPLAQPLQFYLKAWCASSGFGAQPWQGPYDLPAGHTPPVPIDDIYCGETVTPNSPYLYKNFMQLPNPCTSSPHDSRGEFLLRYRSNTDDTLLLRWNFGVGYSGNGLGQGVSFYSKSASLPLDAANWTYRGCWKIKQFANFWDPANWPDIRIPVQKDSVYHILCDDFASWDISFKFFVAGCQVTCPKVDSIVLDAATATTATLRWNSAAPGAAYRLTYYPKTALPGYPVQSLLTTDTTVTVSGLEPSAEYRFEIRTFCTPTDVSGKVQNTFQLGDNLIVKEAWLGRCNPHFLPPGGTDIQKFEEFELNVLQDGNYMLNATNFQGFLYEEAFEPENPAVNLRAAVTWPGPDGRNDTTLYLETGKTYIWVLSTPYTYFQSGGQNNVRVLTDGPAPVQISPPRWRGRMAKPHGTVSTYNWVTFTAICPDTAGWMHFYLQGPGQTLTSDLLLLSIKGLTDSAFLMGLPLTVGTFGGGVTKVTAPPAQFLLNPDGWYEMNRFWLMDDLQPAQQVDSILAIRTYYTEKDFQDMKKAIEQAGGKLEKHEDLYFYKINGFHDYTFVSPYYHHAGVPKASAFDETGYWEYKNGPEASTSTWRYGTFGNAHYAEMLVRGFSGGGGGGSVNGKSAFDPVSKTTDTTTEGWRLELYPHPTPNAFTLELPAPAPPRTTIRITDPTGRTALQQPAEPGATRQTLRADALPNGLYFLQVVSDGRVMAVERFVKQ